MIWDITWCMKGALTMKTQDLQGNRRQLVETLANETDAAR